MARPRRLGPGLHLQGLFGPFHLELVPELLDFGPVRIMAPPGNLELMLRHLPNGFHIDALILELVALALVHLDRLPVLLCLAQQVLHVPPQDIHRIVVVAPRDARLGGGVGEVGVGHARRGAAAMRARPDGRTYVPLTKMAATVPCVRACVRDLAQMACVRDLTRT